MPAPAIPLTCYVISGKSSSLLTLSLLKNKGLEVISLALTDLNGCNLEKRNEWVMLCLKNMRKQRPNCLNTICFSEASITGTICSCVEHWHLEGRLAVLQGGWWREPPCFQLWLLGPSSL